MTTTTTSVPPPATITFTPETTASTVPAVAYGDIVRIESVARREAVAHPLLTQVRFPRLSGFRGHPAHPDHDQRDPGVFNDEHLAAYLLHQGSHAPPAGHYLDFEVLWAGEEARPLLPVVFTDIRDPGRDQARSEARFAFVFALVN
ncbi:MAG: hypothetical protein ABIJ48_06425 [Actinomycetota bacterium]